MKMRQCTNEIFMVEPTSFRMNEETAVNNYFQKSPKESDEEILKQALLEFNTFVSKLKAKGIMVHVVKDINTPRTPDAVFPNNWITFHENNLVVYYPIFAENRRRERQLDLANKLKNGPIKTIDLSVHELNEVYLEGTGSMILDRQNGIAYCSISPRADESLFKQFCGQFGYTPIIFHAYQSVKGGRSLIYHTNVMMCIGEHLAVICSSSIDDERERELVKKNLESSGKIIMDISEEQMNHFAGNMIELIGEKGQHFLVMSSGAFNSLKEEQVQILEKYCEIIHSDLSTIEYCGGGSARCMIAEIF